jgi:hypothetical protein
MGTYAVHTNAASKLRLLRTIVNFEIEGEHYSTPIVGRCAHATLGSALVSDETFSQLSGCYPLLSAEGEPRWIVVIRNGVYAAHVRVPEDLIPYYRGDLGSVVDFTPEYEAAMERGNAFEGALLAEHTG